MKNMFIKANIGNVVIVIIAVLVFFFFRNIKFIPIIYILFLCYFDIWLQKIACEYQRITFMISRIAKLNQSKFSIPELQILMTDDSISSILFFKSFLTGFIVGYFLLNSLIFLVLFLIFQYLLSFIIPTYIPFKYLFDLINKEIKKINIENTREYVEKIKLEKYFEDIPHTSQYENWIFNKYGNELLKFK